MAQASREVEIDAPRDVVFKVVTDFESYPQFLPETKKVEVHSQDDRSAEVSFEIEVIKRIGYTLRFDNQVPESVKWSFVKGKYMKDNQGSWLLEECGEGRTRATYSIELKLGALVPSAIERMLAEKSLPGMLERFKKRAEAQAQAENVK